MRLPGPLLAHPIPADFTGQRLQQIVALLLPRNPGKKYRKRANTHQAHTPCGTDAQRGTRRCTEAHQPGTFHLRAPSCSASAGKRAPSRRGILEQRRRARGDSHKSCQQPGFPSKLRTRLIASHSQKGKLAQPSKIQGRGGKAGRQAADRRRALWRAAIHAERGAAQRPSASLALSNAVSQGGKKNMRGKKKANKNPIVSPPPRLFKSNGGRTLKKRSRCCRCILVCCS